jgi:hypothetical protein
MPHPTPSPDHAGHDPLLVAAYAAGDATGSRLDEAAALVATCAACGALHHDLRAIALALPATAATPPSPRPRDFRLSADQAASLRPSGWRRLLAPLAGPSFAFARPLGTGLATIGLAGILVAGASGIPLGGAASAPAATAAGGEVMLAAPASGDGTEELFAANAPATEAPAAGGGPGAVPDATAAPAEGERSDQGAGGGTPEEPAATGSDTGAASGPEAASGGAGEGAPLAMAAPPMPVLVAGAGLLALVLGVLLVALRWTARRLA